jgi:hypothetical protein
MRSGVRTIANTTGRTNYGAMGEGDADGRDAKSDFSADAQQPCANLKPLKRGQHRDNS